MAQCHARYRSGQASSAMRLAPRWVVFGVHTSCCPQRHSRDRPIPALSVPISAIVARRPAALRRSPGEVTADVSPS